MGRRQRPWQGEGLETAPPLLSPETKGLFFGVALGRLLTVDPLRARFSDHHWGKPERAPHTQSGVHCKDMSICLSICLRPYNINFNDKYFTKLEHPCVLSR